MLKELSNAFFELWSLLDFQRKRELSFVLLATFFTSLIELINLSLIIPFMASLVGAGRYGNYQSTDLISKIISPKSSAELVYFLAFAFGLSSLFAGAMRLLLLRLNARFSFNLGADLSLMLFKKNLFLSYEDHLNISSNLAIDSVITKTNYIVNNFIFPSMLFFSSIIILIVTVAALSYVNFAIVLFSFLTFSVLYLVISKTLQKKLYVNGMKISDSSSMLVRILQESLGNYREITINKLQSYYIKHFQALDINLRSSEAENAFIAMSPRFILEASGMILVSVLAMYMIKHSDSIETSIGVLGIFALGAQKMLPMMQQTYASFCQIRASMPALKGILNLLRFDDVSHLQHCISLPIAFKDKILFKDVSFSYKSTAEKFVLKDVNLCINKGDKIGIIGLSGGGKSTFLDIFLGLLSPTSGYLSIDGVKVSTQNMDDWRANIAQVPQNVFLFDSSIEENIAVGVPKEKIDLDRIGVVAKQTLLYDLLDISEGEHIFGRNLGEDGVHLSGGQRQRVGLARALYHQSKVLVLDEPTSALDPESESILVGSLSNLDAEYTVVMVTHRQSSLSGCNRIFRVADGIIEEVNRPFGAY
ncbi:ABC transporter ATP-binding protein [Polynucleobacter sp. JS-JIR-5-A7]|uniref:ATP-binding cassette domain-containing protein n=1 Tax=Polynucleobacter sp. JS-JIR-5-A7 TaxID=1758395 RepID=UPI001BFE8EE8|nr:ABC transporter ATP-binding protein [Polynucleobacter sp. JS-JIR-5-A7]QWE06933.1 ABC transporter ATP-binding protein [Polynucleobacter sp. JS-JIR-5-A7]